MAIVISMSQLASRTGNLSVSALYSATYMGGHNNYNVICKKSAALVIVYIFSVLFIYLFVCSFLVFQAEEEPSVCDNVDQSATRGRRKSVVKRQPIVEANLISENISFNFKFLFLISFARGRRACRHCCPLPSRRSQIPRPQRRSRRSPRRGSSSRRPWSLKKPRGAFCLWNVYLCSCFVITSRFRHVRPFLKGRGFVGKVIQPHLHKRDIPAVLKNRVTLNYGYLRCWFAVFVPSTKHHHPCAEENKWRLNTIHQKMYMLYYVDILTMAWNARASGKVIFEAVHVPFSFSNISVELIPSPPVIQTNSAMLTMAWPCLRVKIKNLLYQCMQQWKTDGCV